MLKRDFIMSGPLSAFYFEAPHRVRAVQGCRYDERLLFGRLPSPYPAHVIHDNVACLLLRDHDRRQINECPGYHHLRKTAKIVSSH